MKVKELMSTNIVCGNEKSSIEQVVDHMRKNNVGCIPICDDAGHINGIITDRDLVLRYRPNQKFLAGDIMTLNPVTITPEMNVHDAALLFSAHKIRRLPVTEASKIVGMLSLGDIAVKPVYIDEAGDALSAISMADSQQVKS